MTDTDKVEGDLHDLIFYIQRCIRYHMRRTAFFMRWGRFTAFVGVIFGSAAVATLLSGLPSAVIAMCALLVTLASAVDLVVGTGQRTWLHNDLRRRYLGIEAEVVGNSKPTASMIRQMQARIRHIEADEPPTLEALALLARNDVIRAIYPKEEADMHISYLPWYKRTTAQWIDWDTSGA